MNIVSLQALDDVFGSGSKVYAEATKAVGLCLKEVVALLDETYNDDVMFQVQRLYQMLCWKVSWEIIVFMLVYATCYLSWSVKSLCVVRWHQQFKYERKEGGKRARWLSLVVKGLQVWDGSQTCYSCMPNLLPITLTYFIWLNIYTYILTHILCLWLYFFIICSDCAFGGCPHNNICVLVRMGQPQLTQIVARWEKSWGQK